MRRVLLPQQFNAHALPDKGVLRQFQGQSMGTTWSVKLVQAGPCEQFQTQLQGQLDAVNAAMSHWDEASDLMRFNTAPAGAWRHLPPALFEVLSFALDVSAASGGAYDPGAGAMVNAWGFGARGRCDDPAFSKPSALAVQTLLVQQRALHIELDPSLRRACQPGGVLLDLSAVAKGYGVDRLAQYLEAHGVFHYLVEVGGELRGAGVKPDGQPWWVALEAVAQAEGGTPTLVALHGLAVATSGDYRRYFQQGGQRFSHTIDPRTGAPINNNIASVTVLHAQCMAADAWSTALTVLGLEQGLALAERQGLAARFLVRSGVHCGADDAITHHLTEHLTEPMRRMQDDD